MRRFPSFLCSSLAVAAIWGATVAVHADALSTIEARIDIMKGDLKAARLGNDMIKGNVPFDLAKAKGVFATFIDASQKEPELFPEDTKTGDDTTASPKIWQDMAGFKAAYAKFGKELTEAMNATTDLASFKQGFAVVVKNCGSCHSAWRTKS